MFDFPLQLDDLEKVPEEFRHLYEAADDAKDGVTLIPALKKRITEASGAHKALETERKARTAAEKAVKAWKDAAGVEAPDALKDRFDTLETEHATALEEVRKVAGAKGDDASEKRLQQVRDETTREWTKKLQASEDKLKKAEAERDGMKSSLERYMKEHAALAAITSQKGKPALLKRIVMDHLKVDADENGRYVLRVTDEDGDDRFDGEGKPMSVENLVAQMRSTDEYGSAFEGDGASGSGSRSPSGGGKSSVKINPWIKGPNFNATEQAKLMKANPVVAARMQSEAKAEQARK